MQKSVELPDGLLANIYGSDDNNPNDNNNRSYDDNNRNDDNILSARYDIIFIFVGKM